MSEALYRVGRWSFTFRGWVIALWAIALAALILGSSFWGRPAAEGFTIPGTEAQQAMDDLQLAMPELGGASGQLVLVAPAGERIDSPETLPVIETAAQDLGGVAGVGDVSAEAISADGTAVLLSVRFAGPVDEITPEAADQVAAIGATLADDLPDGSQVAIGGEAFAGFEVPHDNLGELIGIGLAFLVLLVTFGSGIAAGLPLIAAITVVGVTLAGLGVVGVVTEVSATAPVLATMLGLALGIDYALFVLFRHLRHLREGMSAQESIARSVATAGSAVVFAGLTVVIALVGLVIVDIPFLTAMGLAAAAAVALAVLSAITLLPALLGYLQAPLGRKVESTRATRATRADRAARAGIPAPRAAAAPSRSARFYQGWVRTVTVRPLLTVVLVVGAVAALAVPALNLRLGLPDAGSQPVDTAARQSYDLVGDHFGPGQNGPLLVTGSLDGQADPAGFVDDLAEDLQRIDGVAAVPMATPDPTGSTGVVAVIPASGPDTQQTVELVADIRQWASGVEAEHGVTLAVTGQTAAGIDVSTLLSDALLPYITFIVVLSMILLAMVFRSIWIPLKATFGFLLTIGAALGAVALVYDLGWFAGPLGVEPGGPVISFMPIIVLGVLFGLAMDYEVFLVSAMREEHVSGTNPRRAVTTGFGRSAPIVTAAALIMFAVFATFVPAADSTIKPIAIALAVGVFVDAFVVRMTLVPAVMVLLDRRAWHLPRALDRILPSFDVEGEKLARRLDPGPVSA